MRTQETRRESYDQTDKQTRWQKVLDAVTEPMTAREILHKVLPYSGDMNAVRPRITELVENGDLIECGKKFDETTKRNVTVFRRTQC